VVNLACALQQSVLRVAERGEFASNNEGLPLAREPQSFR
jgi:hypothetical protein